MNNYLERIGNDLRRFIKANKNFHFNMVPDGIDCGVYVNDWKNLKGIKVEVARIDIYPYSRDCKEDALKIT